MVASSFNGHDLFALAVCKPYGSIEHLCEGSQRFYPLLRMLHLHSALRIGKLIILMQQL